MKKFFGHRIYGFNLLESGYLLWLAELSECWLENDKKNVKSFEISIQFFPIE
jgi:hypothetical protein